MKAAAGRTLVVVHYHFRTGGVLRVIERALSGINSKQFGRVVLFGGERPSESWWHRLRAENPRVHFELRVEPSANYADEYREEGRRRIAAALREILAAFPCPVVWMHNPALGKNPALTGAAVDASAATAAPILFHHHDFWCDNRWQNLSPRQIQSIGGLSELASILLPLSGNVRHLLINGRDFRLFQSVAPDRSHFFPNPFRLQLSEKPSASAIHAARSWLRDQFGIPSGSPLWLLPSRFLRRKNIAEAVVLASRMEPEAWVVVAGGPTSERDVQYAGAIERVANRRNQKFASGILSGVEGEPSMETVLSASDLVLLPSLQEGFGLPFLEATALGKLLLCRRLSNVLPDLEELGFEFPMAYEETRIQQDAFNLPAECERQRAIFSSLRGFLPEDLQTLAPECPHFLSERKARTDFPFSRLSLRAQLEVLEQLPDHSMPLPEPLCGRWPDRASALDPTVYAERLFELAETPCPPDLEPGSPERLLESLSREFLQPEPLYPLLME